MYNLLMTNEKKWLAEHGYKDYPDDLPFKRKMLRGPHTPEGALRYLDADYPLPGSFPEAERRSKGRPAWADYLEEGVIYPGAIVGEHSAADRERRVQRLVDSDYQDRNAAFDLMEFDRITGFNPLFEFQYAVLNLRKYSEVIVFEVNGERHALHWHNLYGYAIDNQYISHDAFNLFELVASSLGDENAYYPVIDVIRTHMVSPAKFWSRQPHLKRREPWY